MHDQCDGCCGNCKWRDWQARCVMDHMGTRSTSLLLEHLPPQIDSFPFSLVFRILRHQYSDSTTDIIYHLQRPCHVTCGLILAKLYPLTFSGWAPECQSVVAGYLANLSVNGSISGRSVAHRNTG